MLSANKISIYAQHLLRFYTDEVPGEVLILDEYCLEILNSDSIPIVKDIVSSEESLIVVYRNKVNLETKTYEIASSGKPNDSSLELIGTPLECPFSLNESSLECSILSNSRNFSSTEKSPLSVNEAYILINLFNDIIEHLKKENQDYFLPLLVILCDGNDVGATRAVGIQKLKHITKRLRVSCADKLIPITKLPKLDLMKRRHVCGMTNSDLNIVTKAKYIVLDGSDKSEILDLKKSSIVVDCEWKSATKVLEVPNIDAKCLVNLLIALGDNRNPANCMWHEIEILEDLVKCSKDLTLNWTRTNQNHLVFDKLNQFLLSKKTLSKSRKHESKDKLKDFDLPSNLIQNRENKYFTDELWTILKDCASCEELLRCLRLVLETAANREIKPLVYGNNKSEFGKLVNDVYHRKMEPSCLSISMCVTYLIEIGIEKLKQDYFQIFLDSGLVTRDCLGIFFIQTNDLASKLLDLKRLHLATEIVSLTQTYLNNAFGLLCSYARNALKQVGDLKCVGDFHSFSFPIDRHFLTNCFSENLPYFWTISLNSKQNSYSSCSVNRFSVDDIEKTECFSKQIKKNSENDETYYHCSSTIISDNFNL